MMQRNGTRRRQMALRHPTPLLLEAGRVGASLTRLALRGLSRGLLALRLADLALELLAALRQLLVLGLQQEGVEAAAPLHRLQRVRADAQAHLALQRIARSASPRTGWGGRCAWSCSRRGCVSGRTWAACPSTRIAGSWKSSSIAGRRGIFGHIGARGPFYTRRRRTSRLPCRPCVPLRAGHDRILYPSALWWPRHTIDAKPASLGNGEAPVCVAYVR